MTSIVLKRAILSGMITFLPALARGAAIVAQERLPYDTNGSTWNFSNIPDPTNTDYADASQPAGVTFTSADTPYSGYSSLSYSNDSPGAGKTGQTSSDPASESVWFNNNGSNTATILIDLKQLVDVTSFESFSWHNAETRTQQKYMLYGSSDNTAPSSTSNLTDTQLQADGWTPIAAVLSTNNSNGNGSNPTNATNTVPWDENGTGAKTGVYITDSTGSLGTYRYLLLDLGRASSTFYGEFDVDASPASIPEPVSLSLITVGGMGLMRRRSLR